MVLLETAMLTGQSWVYTGRSVFCADLFEHTFQSVREQALIGWFKFIAMCKGFQEYN